MEGAVIRTPQNLGSFMSISPENSNKTFTDIVSDLQDESNTFQQTAVECRNTIYELSAKEAELSRTGNDFKASLKILVSAAKYALEASKKFEPEAPISGCSAHLTEQYHAAANSVGILENAISRKLATIQAKKDECEQTIKDAAVRYGTSFGLRMNEASKAVIKLDAKYNNKTLTLVTGAKKPLLHQNEKLARYTKSLLNIVAEVLSPIPQGQANQEAQVVDESLVQPLPSELVPQDERVTAMKRTSQAYQNHRIRYFAITNDFQLFLYLSRLEELPQAEVVEICVTPMSKKLPADDTQFINWNEENTNMFADLYRSLGKKWGIIAEFFQVGSGVVYNFSRTAAGKAVIEKVDKEKEETEKTNADTKTPLKRKLDQISADL
eukprot:TRINITY_DN557_c0_g1_i1.p1 TRINITY_DN557_c0_g1~~TRINITY_DN557_c0_g1_i1.p1  ORF type:complete len:392 (-),score=81.21 TRINITY_DN557_c0_g1_i1:60-1202(-)